jgi:AcrR family transcriptional regulator
VEHAEIKKVLIDLDLTVAGLAREVGVSRNTLYRYLHHKLRAESTRAAIQRALNRAARRRGTKAPVLWPSTRAAAPSRRTRIKQ